MRIVHIIDYYQPQMGYQETFLALEHVYAGHDVHVITSDRYYPHPQYETTWQPVLGPRCLTPGEYQEDGLTVHRLPSRLEHGVRLWLRRLPQELTSLRPDFVLMHGMGSYTAIRVARLRRQLGPGCKLVFDSHANDVNSRNQLRSLYYSMYRRLLTPLFLNSADAIVAIDDNSKAFLMRECAMPADRIALIPMGADTRLFRHDPAARRKVREELGWGDTDVVVTFAGKVQRRKGVHLLIEAALLSLPQHRDLKFMIVGGGEDDYIAAMQQTIATAGWSDSFRWVGMIPNRELYRYYSASDISVWPEQVSIGTFEAQACSLPLIVADAPVLRERVQPDTGYLYSPGDTLDLSAKINSLAADRQLRAALGAAGRKHIETSHSWRAIAQQFIDLVGT